MMNDTYTKHMLSNVKAACLPSEAAASAFVGLCLHAVSYHLERHHCRIRDNPVWIQNHMQTPETLICCTTGNTRHHSHSSWTSSDDCRSHTSSSWAPRKRCTAARGTCDVQPCMACALRFCQWYILLAPTRQGPPSL
jgi:hypothetical protein